MSAAKNPETYRQPSFIAANIDNAWPEEKHKAHSDVVKPRKLGSLISEMNGCIDDLLVRYAYPEI